MNSQILDTVLTPFLFLIKLFFNLGYIISFNSAGLAIILLSAFVFLSSLPLNKLINNFIKKEDVRKNKIKTLIDEINSVYVGQTRFFYIKTLYKIHGINSWSNFYSIIKLLIQIPFFLAAYHFLSDFSLLEGTPFLTISNLHDEDQLIAFGGIRLNLLPVLMLVLSLFNNHLFAKDNKNERAALSVVSLLFFVFLYNEPSALVLYWSCTNLLTLINEAARSKEWLRLSVHKLKRPRPIDPSCLFGAGLSILIFLILKFILLQEYSNKGFNYVFYFTIPATAALIIYSCKLKPKTIDINFQLRHSIFLLIGTYTPLFIYGKNNYEFIKDGLIQHFFSSLIIPSFCAFFAIFYLLKKLNLAYAINGLVATFLIFFSLPIINNVLSIAAEDSLPYSIFFLLFTNFIIFKIDKKLLKIFSYVSLLVFFISCVDFMSVHFAQFESEQKIVKKILDNKKTSEMYKVIQPNLSKVKNIPPVYLLIYDALTGRNVMDHYGLDYDLKFLEDEGFKVYGDILSYKGSSVPSMSGVLELSSQSVLKPTHQKKHMVGFNLVDKLFESVQMDRTYMAANYFFKGKSSKAGSNIVKVRKRKFNSLLKGVLIGEFKFDLDFKDDYERNNWIRVRRKLIEGNKGFLYSHNPYPGHSQNSGKCRKNEIDIYSIRRDKAIMSIKEDIKSIKRHNPKAIIILAGDHGGYLTADCIGMNSQLTPRLALPVLAETNGTFLAIKWPSNDYAKYDDIKNLQGIFHSVFAYITKDKEILKYSPRENVCRHGFCTSYEGKVLSGKHNDQFIFDALKLYELEQL